MTLVEAEQRATTFLLKYQHLGYVSVNPQTIRRFAKVIMEVDNRERDKRRVTNKQSDP